MFAPSAHLVSDHAFQTLCVGVFTTALVAALLACLRDLAQPEPLSDPHGTWAILVSTVALLLFMIAANTNLPRYWGVEEWQLLAIVLLTWVFGLVNAIIGLYHDRPDSKSRWFLGTLTLVLAVIAFPNFRSTRHHSPTLSCYANQKTIAGAVEMYNLDKNTRRTVLDGDLWQALRSGGYLQSVPQDPTAGPGSSSQYSWTSAGNGIRCARHGVIQY
ncbi:MAG: hypothetical protein HY815_26770 [Candidatus Riflebacteria bacterium]|nr:hypothetical protein [Candidatus Riflebacteria bacterium]